jgi:hypothetical protein
MASLKTQQDALVKNAEETKNLVEAVLELSNNIKIQHDDNIKS